ncbi:MAG: hydrogenase formation protein HypD [bacterium]
MKKSKFTLMEVCGTHTMAIARAGIKKVLPSEVRLISGPGCPVCVTPQHDIDVAIEVAGRKDVIMTTFGDMMRVPGTRSSFNEVRTKGADVRVLYSPLDALNIAEDNPEKKVVFMGVGFETTSPTVAATVLEAKKRGTKNFFVLSNFKVVFPALEAISKSSELNVDGFICPGHVSVITGSIPYEDIARRYRKPCVIMGFEPVDIIKGIKRLVEQISSRDYTTYIEYTRAVSKNGNTKAQSILGEVFKVVDSNWRGIGVIGKSGLKLNDKYKCFDAEKEFLVKIPRAKEPKGCLCGKVLQGVKRPSDCKLFSKVCTPQKPIGPCMVSSEGTCAAYYKYGE